MRSPNPANRPSTACLEPGSALVNGLAAMTAKRARLMEPFERLDPALETSSFVRHFGRHPVLAGGGMSAKGPLLNSFINPGRRAAETRKKTEVGHTRKWINVFEMGKWIEAAKNGKKTMTVDTGTRTEAGKDRKKTEAVDTGTRIEAAEIGKTMERVDTLKRLTAESAEIKEEIRR